MGTKLADITDPTTMFDRAAELTPPPRKALKEHDGTKFAEFELHAARVSLHPDLPDTPVWAYDGRVPGPTVVVDAGDHVHTRVVNRIGSKLPYEHVVVNDDPPGTGTMNAPGAEYASKADADLKERAAAAALTACCVTHLHGAPTPPDSDGWAESVCTHGEAAHHHYQFRRETFEAPPWGKHPRFVRKGGAGPMFWYHDHAMGATRLNNYAGLAGVWIVRDPVEHRLGLPTDERHELPLVLQDRNLQTADGTAAGDLTGGVLHKVQRGVRECFGPATVVSGKLWPRVPVARRVYRLRVLNGSNARYFRLNFFGLAAKTDAPPYTRLTADMVQQIGTDGGLLGAAADLPADGLLLAPAERADVLIDFGLVAAEYAHVAVFNNAPAPYGKDESFPNAWEPDTDPDPANDNHRPFPQVMRFDLHPGEPAAGLGGRPIRGMPLDPDFHPLPTKHDELPPHGHSLVVLREEDEVIRDENGHPVDAAGKPVDYAAAETRTMLFLHEMMLEADADRAGMNMHKVIVPDAPATAPRRFGIKVRLAGPAGVETYVTVAKRFTDATTIFIVKGAWHMWKVLNLSPDSHPFHVHLTQLQAVKREQFAPAGKAAIPKEAYEFDLTGPATDMPVALDGWKDTFRVNPGERGPADEVATAEMLTIFGQFSQHAGRYMYHCHILEHEDADMMRPFVVMPAPLMAFMGHGGMAHHATTMAPKLASEGKL